VTQTSKTEFSLDAKKNYEAKNQCATSKAVKSEKLPELLQTGRKKLYSIVIPNRYVKHQTQISEIINTNMFLLNQL
jgi:hypothetical protein